MSGTPDEITEGGAYLWCVYSGNTDMDSLIFEVLMEWHVTTFCDVRDRLSPLASVGTSLNFSGQE